MKAVQVGGAGGRCAACRNGDFIDCANLQIPGIAYDGGYAEYMAAPQDALAQIPDKLSAVDAAPRATSG